LVSTPNPLNLTAEELTALRNLKAGFYEVPPGHPVWQRLQELVLISFEEPPRPPIQLTREGWLYDTGPRTPQ
jgi:hypothetical protein